jgi:V/A-type H+/Na+-transporting ATPase subunit D
VNLFDKVLIPETRGNIRTIQVYLDDKAREAVVTSKIAKAKQQAAEQGGVS